MWIYRRMRKALLAILLGLGLGLVVLPRTVLAYVCRSSSDTCAISREGDRKCIPGDKKIYECVDSNWEVISNCSAYGCTNNVCTCNSAPTATPTNTPVPCLPDGSFCAEGGICCPGLYCSGVVCQPNPTVTPTPINTPTPTPTPVCEENVPPDHATCHTSSPYCEKECQISDIIPVCNDSQSGLKDVECWTNKNCFNNGYLSCSLQHNILDYSACPPYFGCTPTPTRTPTPTPWCASLNSSCNGDAECCSNYCDGDSLTCQPHPNPTSTPTPTITNTPWPTRGPTPTTYCQPYACQSAPSTWCPGFDPSIVCGGIGNCDNCGGVDCGVCPGAPTGVTPMVTPGECNCYAYPTLMAQTCVNSGFACPTPPTYCINGTLGCTPPGGVTLLTPNDGAVVTPAGGGVVNLDWNGPASWGQCGTANSYQVCAGSSATNPCNGGVSASTLETVSTYNYTQSVPGTYYWQVTADNGPDCANTSSVIRSFRLKGPPTIPTPGVPANSPLVIKNSGGAEVLVQTGNRNHICETPFQTDANPREVKFILQVSDPDGYTDISSVQMRLNGTTYPMTLLSGVGLGATFQADITFPSSSNNGGVYGIDVDATDTTGLSTGWVASGRSWKVWDCQVPVSGTLYDGSAGLNCASAFLNEANAEMEFSGMIYNYMGIYPWSDVTMSVSPPQNYGTNSVNWLGSYLPLINGGEVATDINGTLKGSGRLNRITSSNGTQWCGAVPNQFTVSSYIDAYLMTPTLDVDMSFIRDQDSWFQVKGSGIAAGGSVTVGVPVTCATDYADGGDCAPAISLDSGYIVGGGGVEDDGVVSAPVISSTSGCDLNTPCYYGLWRNRWYNGSVLSTNDIYDYRTIYQNYFAKYGAGVTIPTNATMTNILAPGIGGTGVVLVNGNVTVDVGNTVGVGKFLMVVASGRITVDVGVTRVEGVFVADQGFVVSGINDSILNVNGILYSPVADITINRGHTDQILNNEEAGTIVNYRPDMLFNMPVELVEVLSRWRGR